MSEISENSLPSEMSSRFQSGRKRQYGQTGMITSTPTSAKRQRQFESPQSELQFDVESRDTDDTFLASEELSSDDESTIVEETTKIKKFVLKGKDFNMFKPKRKQSLYAQIIQNFDRLEMLVDTWNSVYEKSESAAIELVLQLFVDVMGFQNVIIEYVDENTNFDLIREKLEASPPKIHERFLCVLKGQSSFCKTFSQVFCSFLNTLMQSWYRINTIYNFNIYTSLISFVTSLCKSKRRILLYNCCVIALKLCTNFVIIRQDKLINMGAYNDDSSDSRETDDQNKLNLLNNCIHAITTLINTYSNIPDCEMHQLRVTYAEEVKVWIRLSPEYFITEKILTALRRQLVDEHKSVRIAALSCCVFIMKARKNARYVKKNWNTIEKLIETIAKRIWDININVQILCIRFFTNCLQNYPVTIPEETRKAIFNLMYCKYFDIAKECGYFYSFYLRADEDELHTLQNVLLANKLPQKKTCLLVEALILYIPELTNVPLMVSILTEGSDLFSSSDKIEMFEVIYHVCSILINGTTDYKRMKPLKELNFGKNNLLIAGAIIPQASDLFESFWNNDLALLWLLRILNVFDYNDISFNKFRVELKSILIHLVNILAKNMIHEILVQIALLFKTLCDERCPFGMRYAPGFEMYLDSVVKLNKKQLYDSQQESVSKAQLCNLRNSTYLLSVLFQYHSTVHILRWDQIFVKWQDSSLWHTIIKYQIMCCRSYLKWQLKHLVNNKNTTEIDLNTYKQMAEQFLEACFQVLQLNKVESLQITAYEAICDFCMECTVTEEFIQKNKDFEMLQFDLSSYETSHNMLRNFVTRKCFDEATDSKEARLRYLLKYIVLIFLGYIAQYRLSDIFRFYALFKDDYSQAYKVVLENFKSELARFVLFILIDCHKEGDTVRNIKTLAIEFTYIIPKAAIIDVIKLGIKHVSTNKSDFSILIYLKPFAAKLFAADRPAMVEYMKENLPDDYFDIEVISQFLQHLKSKKVKADWVRQIPDSLEGSTQRRSIRSNSNTSQSVTVSCTNEDYSIVDIDEDN